MNSIAEIHNDEQLRRYEFPVACKKVFLGNAAVCPYPRRVAQAVSDYAMNATLEDQEKVDPINPRLFVETRRLSADLLGCESEDIALIGPTSIGLSLIANGIKWQKGMNVVYAPDDYPSNAVVWMNLEKQGVEVRPLMPKEPGCISVWDVERLLDGNTKLVALSSAHFVTGYRLNIDEIGKLLTECGILFSVDGIQTLGALRTSVKYVDFLAADAHKWLLGPCAMGILYVSEEGREAMEPTLLGWANVNCPGYITPDKVIYPRDARRYEAGSPNLLGLVGMRESLRMIQEYGIGPIEETVIGHTRHIRMAVHEKRYQLASSDNKRLSGITAFRKPDIDMTALYKRLNEAGIVASHRQTRDGRSWIRFSPHFYNTVRELDFALNLL